MNLENYSIDSFICNNKLIEFLKNYKYKNLNSNLFFFGKNGSGKTYLSKILIKYFNLESIYLNFLNIKSQVELSDKIEYFGNKKLTKNRLIIIDDIDSFSKNIQNNILNLIDKYNKKLIFIFTSCEIHQLTENLKNKFIFFQLNDFSDKELFIYLKNYSIDHNITIPDDNIKYIIDISHNVLINCVNNLKKYKLLNSNSYNIIDIYSSASFEYFTKILNICKQNNIIKLITIVEDLYKLDYSFYDNINNFFNFIKKYDDINEICKIEIIKIIGLSLANDTANNNDLIHLIYVFTQIFLIFNKDKKIENKYVIGDLNID